MYFDKIYQTYRSNFTALSAGKQFHFASRMHLVLDDAWAKQQINQLKEWFLGGTNIAGYTSRLADIANTKPSQLHVNAAIERMPLFNSYPWLFGYESQLFQILHATVQYDTDLQSLVNSPKKLDQQLANLVSDSYSLAVLSTYLVDIYYLYHRMINHDERPLIDIAILKNALRQPIDGTYKARLNVYMLTHCIIGETLFYSRAIANSKQQYYMELAGILEQLALQEWDDLTIDNKLEIAFCLKTINLSSSLVQRAVSESEAHFDQERGYIIDPKMPHKNDLEWAEHRNVLYLMTVGKLT